MRLRSATENKLVIEQIGEMQQTTPNEIRGWEHDWKAYDDEIEYETPQHAAKKLCVTTKTLAEYAKNGLLKYKQTIGKHRRYDVDGSTNDIAFIEACEQGNASKLDWLISINDRRPIADGFIRACENFHIDIAKKLYAMKKAYLMPDFLWNKMIMGCCEKGKQPYVTPDTCSALEMFQWLSTVYKTKTGKSQKQPTMEDVLRKLRGEEIEDNDIEKETPSEFEIPVLQSIIEVGCGITSKKLVEWAFSKKPENIEFQFNYRDICRKWRLKNQVLCRNFIEFNIFPESKLEEVVTEGIKGCIIEIEKSTSLYDISSKEMRKHYGYDNPIDLVTWIYDRIKISDEHLLDIFYEYLSSTAAFQNSSKIRQSCDFWDCDYFPIMWFYSKLGSKIDINKAKKMSRVLLGVGREIDDLVELMTK